MDNLNMAENKGQMALRWGWHLKAYIQKGKWKVWITSKINTKKAAEWSEACK